MKKRRINIITCCLALLSLCGCIHESMEAEGTDPTLANVTLDMTLDLELLPFTRSNNVPSVPEGYTRRFTIDVYREGKVMADKRQVVTNVKEEADGTFTIPVSFKLHALEYTLATWVDYVKESNGDTISCFNTENLSNVWLTTPYCNNTALREAFCGKTELDLTPYRDRWDAQIKQTMNLKRPQAQFRIIATDVQEFLTRMAAKNRQVTEYQVKLSYDFFVPTAFNVVGDVLCAAHTGVNFTTPCNIIADEDGNCEMAGDYVFAGADRSFVTATIEVTDAEGTVVSRVNGLEIPFRQGQLTTVTGKFLTTLVKPGIGIDTDYDGEFNITIDIP